jgi:hypothetical protein
MLGSIARSQLYADSRDRVPMKILDVLLVKMTVFSTHLSK